MNTRSTARTKRTAGTSSAGWRPTASMALFLLPSTGGRSGSAEAQAGVGRAAGFYSGAADVWPPPSWTISSRPRPDPGVQHAACHASAGTPNAAACAPGRRLAYWLFCAQTVDNLCRKAPDLSAHAEMLGIPAAGPAHKRAFNCKNTIHTLCTGRNLGCPYATPEQLINELNVYRKFIRL